jgi:hypothetical protein
VSAADPRNVGEGRRALVHLGAGIGNVVLATPLLVALDALGLRIDLWLSADYPQTASLFSGWGLVETIHERPTNIPFAAYDVLVPAIPPFYWPRFEQYFRGRQATLSRPPDARFYADEQGFNLDFARRLGWQAEQRPCTGCPWHRTLRTARRVPSRHARWCCCPAARPARCVRNAGPAIPNSLNASTTSRCSARRTISSTRRAAGCASRPT